MNNILKVKNFKFYKYFLIGLNIQALKQQCLTKNSWLILNIEIYINNYMFYAHNFLLNNLRNFMANTFFNKS